MPQIDYTPPNRLMMIVGNYGSGKTEVSVNLAIYLAKLGKRVDLADLDIVNPYFRSREAQAAMADHGVTVVIPPGDQQFADLPIVVPRIKGMLRPSGEDYSIFDVGGDDVGARMLSSLRPALGNEPYSLLQVINSRRPFTSTVGGCLTMMDQIEKASRMKVTGLISNAHLVDQTDADVVVRGYEITAEVARRSGVPVEFVTAMSDLAEVPAITQLDAPIFRLVRNMLPPWLRGQEETDNLGKHSNVVPAARTKPVFRP